MSVRRLAVSCIVAGSAAFAWFGCGGDSSGPGSRPTSVTGVAGDSQIGPTGTQLQFPLSFVILDAEGAPFEGATVTWAVQSGTASLSPPTSTSDASGLTSTTVTLGALEGEVVIRATTPGIQPVTFHALVVDPCVFAISTTIGTSLTPALAATDCHVDGAFYTDYFEFDVTGQQSIRLLQSATWDTYMEFYRIEGPGVAFNDDLSPTSTNSRIDAILAPGTYLVAASSWNPNVTGAYSLSIQPRAATLADCNVVWMTAGVTVTDAVQATDCADSTGRYFDFVALYLQAGTVLKVAQRSAAVDARLEIRTGGGVLQVENDDSSATTTDAYATFTVPSQGPYVVFPGTSTPGETGAYTLEITATPPPGSPTRSLAPRLLPLGTPKAAVPGHPKALVPMRPRG
jgi:hypothetical protein